MSGFIQGELSLKVPKCVLDPNLAGYGANHIFQDISCSLKPKIKRLCAQRDGFLFGYHDSSRLHSSEVSHQTWGMALFQ